MKEKMLEAAARLRAMPAWTRGLLLILLILLLYQVFLEVSYFVDIGALDSCPDCGR
jgi:formate hydrogenlyase subunit 4